jgi:hypothetical protein
MPEMSPEPDSTGGANQKKKELDGSTQISKIDLYDDNCYHL